MRAFDALVATLIVFPLLADAFLLRMPAFGLDLSDLRIPLAVAALAALTPRLLRWWRGLSSAEKSRVTREAPVLVAIPVALFLLRWWLDRDAPFALWNLTYASGAVLLAALAALAARRWSGDPWSESFFLRRGHALALAWRGAVERAPARALWGAAAAAATCYFWVSIARHRAFDSHGWDLGIFTNAMWNLTHGLGYVSSLKGGMNLFADHQSPLFWALAPLFALLPRPETLLAAQALGLAAGGPALYYLGRARFGAGHWAAGALPWLYWCYLPLRNANAFDFHPEVFMLPLFLWAFAGFASSRGTAKVLGGLALVGALAAKESAPVVAVGIGLAWMLVSARPWRERWPGLALALGGTALFFFDVNVVPGLFGGGYPYMNLYGRFGGGIGDVLLAPLTQPLFFLSQLLNAERLHFLFWTLAPLGFLPLFAWRAALAAAPVYLMLFLAEGDQRVRIAFHYGIEPASALFWALPFGVAAFAARFGWRVAGAWMLFWALACFGPREAGWARPYELPPQARWLAASRALDCIDPSAPTAASDALSAHLATRPWISFPNALRQPSGELVSCVVTDTRLDSWPLGPGGVERVLRGLPAQGFREVYRCRSFSVYQRDGASCLRCTPEC